MNLRVQIILIAILISGCSGSPNLVPVTREDAEELLQLMIPPEYGSTQDELKRLLDRDLSIKLRVEKDNLNEVYDRAEYLKNLKMKNSRGIDFREKLISNELAISKNGLEAYLRYESEETMIGPEKTIIVTNRVEVVFEKYAERLNIKSMSFDIIRN